MKKVISILVILSLLIFSFSIFVFADEDGLSQKIPFYKVDANNNADVVSNVMAAGDVNIVTPGGRIALMIHGKIKGLEPKTEYFVWVRNLQGYTGDGESLLIDPTLGFYKLAKIVTNKQGKASFHIKIKRSELTVNGSYEIQVAINKPAYEGDNVGKTIVATKWVPRTNVIVASGIE